VARARDHRKRAVCAVERARLGAAHSRARDHGRDRQRRRQHAHGPARLSRARPRRAPWRAHEVVKAAISWSGGKDSLAALAAVRGDLDVVVALTMFDESGARSRSHGLRPELIAAQAARLGLRTASARCSWPSY